MHRDRRRGCLSFADELRAGGHVAQAPDLYDGKTFADLDAGVGYAREVGFDTISQRGRLVAEGLANEIVYAGFSLGVMPAQMLAQSSASSTVSTSCESPPPDARRVIRGDTELAARPPRLRVDRAK